VIERIFVRGSAVWLERAISAVFMTWLT